MKFQEIVDRTLALAARPVRKLDPGKITRVMKEFIARTAGSARLFEQAGKVLPRGIEHAWAPRFPYPLFMNHGKGQPRMGRGWQRVPRLHPGGRAAHPRPQPGWFAEEHA